MPMKVDGGIYGFPPSGLDPHGVPKINPPPPITTANLWLRTTSQPTIKTLYVACPQELLVCAVRHYVSRHPNPSSTTRAAFCAGVSSSGGGASLGRLATSALPSFMSTLQGGTTR